MRKRSAPPRRHTPWPKPPPATHSQRPPPQVGFEAELSHALTTGTARTAQHTFINHSIHTLCMYIMNVYRVAAPVGSHPAQPHSGLVAPALLRCQPRLHLIGQKSSLRRSQLGSRLQHLHLWLSQIELLSSKHTLVSRKTTNRVDLTHALVYLTQSAEPVRELRRARACGSTQRKQHIASARKLRSRSSNPCVAC